MSSGGAPGLFVISAEKWKQFRCGQRAGCHEFSQGSDNIGLEKVGGT